MISYTTPSTHRYTLSLHDALPISRCVERAGPRARRRGDATPDPTGRAERAGQDRERRTRPVQPAGERAPGSTHGAETRSEEHTSELQSRQYLVCRLLLEKKKQNVL